MKVVNRIGLAIVLGVSLLALLTLCAHAGEAPAMWPCHTPVRAGLDDTQQSALLGLIMTIGAILLCW